MITLGRDPSNNEVINDPLVSRFHIQLIVDSFGNCSVRDLESTNGTYVNGRRITATAALIDGDVLKIGNTIIPWKKYTRCGGETTIHDIPESSPAAPGRKKKKPQNDEPGKKKINWRNVLTMTVTVISLLLMIMYLIRTIKGF